MICVIFRPNYTNMDNELGFLEGCTPTIKNTSTAKKAKKKKREKQNSQDINCKESNVDQLCKKSHKTKLQVFSSLRKAVHKIRRCCVGTGKSPAIKS